MSPTSKIITAILVAAIIIAGAIVWTRQDSSMNQVASTNTTPPPAETISTNNPPAALVPPPNAVPGTPPPAEKIPEESFEESLPTGSWVLTRVTLDNKTANLNVNVPEPLTLTFNTKTKSVTGFFGCNTFSGKYTAGSSYENNFSFNTLASTKKACGAIALEGTISQAMNNVTNWGMKGDQLVLSNTNSSTEIVYNQAK